MLSSENLQTTEMAEVPCDLGELESSSNSSLPRGPCVQIMHGDNSTQLMGTQHTPSTSLPIKNSTQGITENWERNTSVTDSIQTQTSSMMSTPKEVLLHNEITDTLQTEHFGYTFMNTTENLMSTVNSTVVPGLYNVTMTVQDYSNSSCNYSCLSNVTHDHHLPVHISLLDVLMAIVLSVFIICIIIGNIMVIASVILFRDMRTLTNVLIASLAIADLLVAIIVLPLSLHFEIMDHLWTLGPIVCDFWITSDVFCCTASILNIVVIAMDRYWLITRNVRYTHSVRFPRKRVCLVMVFLAWLLSTVISISPLFGWRAGSEKEDYTCLISQDLGYTVFSTFGAFWFPLSIILITYFKIFKVARKRAQTRMKSRSICPSINTSSFPTETQNGCPPSSVRGTTKHSDSCDISPPPTLSKNRDSINNGDTQLGDEMTGNSALSPTEESTYLVQETDITSVHNNNTYMETAIHSTEDTQQGESLTNNHLNEDKQEAVQPIKQYVPDKTQNSVKGSHPMSNGKHSSLKRTSTTFTKKSSSSSSSQTSYFSSKTRRHFQRLGKCGSSRMRRRNKMRSSARTLGLIIGCFVICWMPFFLVASVLPFCEVCGQHMPLMVQSITLWLGYSNSLLNPAIYAIWDKNFRRSFKKLLKCQVNWSYVFYS